MEGIQDSPSEVFRRREEKKKQVEVARQQAAVAKDRPEPMFNPRHLVMIAGLGALVLLLIGLLVFAAWRTRPSSSFELAVNDFLAKGISNADRVAAIKSAEALGTKLPASPSSREREAWIRLQNGTQRLRAAELEEWGASLGKQRQQLIGDREQLDVDRARARIDADFLLAERVRLDLDLADLESQRGEILERQMSLKTSAETAASLDARIAAQRDNLAKLQAQVRRSSRAAQQLELIEYCRNRRFSDARLLVEGMSGTTEEALQWRKQKLAEIEVTQRIIDTVYDSGGLFAGTRLSAGRLASVSKDRLRVVKSSGAVDTYEDALLNSLTVREIADMLATAELAIGETSEMAELALCWGEFKYAVSLRPNDEALQQLTSECLTFSKNEITLFYQSGNRKYAAALASRLRTRFAGLSQYQEVEDSLRDMFGVARTTVPDLDAGVPAATLVLPTAPTVPAVLPTPSTPPKPVPRVSPAD